MKSPGLSARFLPACVWGISVQAAWSSLETANFGKTSSPPMENPGIAWLALPAVIPGPDPLEAWKALDEIPSAASVEGAGATVDPVDPVLTGMEEDNATVSSWELLGRIVKEDFEVYCFFDTMREIWVRLAVGEADETAGLRLERPGGGESLQLKDLKSGINYVIHPSEWSLAPLAKSD